MSSKPVAPSQGVRHRSFAVFPEHEGPAIAGNRHRRMRAQNFVVEWVESGGNAFEVESPAEMLLIFPDVGATVTPLAPQGEPVAVPNKGSACVVAAGRCRVQLVAPGTCTVIASSRPDVDPASVINDSAYAQPDARIKPTGRPFQRQPGAPLVTVFDMAQVTAPADNPRLKMLQTDTLSINWVEYQGVRDRKALSPHSHSDLEQGSLALAGNFIHHLRVNWGRDANLWRDDEHLAAASPSLVVVPVDLVHTTEGVGEGHHLLLDVFSPPREDFIAKGWVHNAGDYAIRAPQP
ncbi:hypothetical protein [Hydrogenophaga laconesensis]|uniref:5-deoxy-glucuronate isomerase n=1 Tax=Hydrogenophaga laconesensis TaxID=1805971 RepID=A0ABU1VDL8_9BURK|nr:hypothetical protein [Hydrogenophaga laconesensis]MDR7095571.1 hypothetical protein [Hydrogenophaga laconesensis]